MKKVIVILFVVLIGIVSLVSAVIPDIDISENENRGLMTKSKLSRNIADSSFQHDYEQYLSDQFPFRKTVITADAVIKRALGRQDINGAYINDDNRLFQKLTADAPDEKALLKNAKKISSAAEQSGKPLYVMLVPSAGISLGSLMPSNAPMYDFNALKASLEGAYYNAIFVDIYGALNEPDDYYLTDHHWTAKGAYKAYSAWKKVRGEEPEKPSFKKVSTDFHGTLYSKIPLSDIPYDEISLPEVSNSVSVNADGKDILLYQLDALETKDKYNVFEGGNHGVVIITNEDNKNGKTLLLFKDSFANSFVPYLVGDYSKIIMVDERYAFFTPKQAVGQFNPDEIAVIKEIIS